MRGLLPAAALITLSPVLGLGFSKPLFSKFAFIKNAMAGSTSVTEDALFKALTAFQGNQPWGRFLDGEVFSFKIKMLSFLAHCVGLASSTQSFFTPCAAGLMLDYLFVAAPILAALDTSWHWDAQFEMAEWAQHYWMDSSNSRCSICS
jgi:hypothetical protein